jgi:hypothetical protein
MRVEHRNPRAPYRAWAIRCVQQLFLSSACQFDFNCANIIGRVAKFSVCQAMTSRPTNYLANRQSQVGLQLLCMAHLRWANTIRVADTAPKPLNPAYSSTREHPLPQRSTALANTNSGAPQQQSSVFEISGIVLNFSHIL